MTSLLLCPRNYFYDFGAPKPAALRRVLEEAKSFNTEDAKDTEEFDPNHILC